MTGVQYCLAAIVLACVAAGVWMGVQERRDEREAAAADEARRAALDAPDEAAVRLAHLDAVWAQCLASRPYVNAILAGFEAEVTGLLELGLELDDQSPKPSEDA